MTIRLVHGIGINDADYVLERKEELPRVDGVRKRKVVWTCPYYNVWKRMIQRCYSVSYQKTRPTYIGCVVFLDWLTFSKFRDWMINQDWEGKQLDKDLLFDGNKLYSPDTCIFVSCKINSFVLDSAAIRGDCLIGVTFNKAAGKFVSRCSDPFIEMASIFLGYFCSEIDAHNAWKTHKHMLACKLAETQTDPRVINALVNKYKGDK